MITRWPEAWSLGPACTYCWGTSWQHAGWRSQPYPKANSTLLALPPPGFHYTHCGVEPLGLLQRPTYGPCPQEKAQPLEFWESGPWYSHLYLTQETQPPLFYLDSHPPYLASEETKDLKLNSNGASPPQTLP